MLIVTFVQGYSRTNIVRAISYTLSWSDEINNNRYDNIDKDLDFGFNRTRD